jgi:hypothetical protein
LSMGPRRLTGTFLLVANESFDKFLNIYEISSLTI